MLVRNQRQVARLVPRSLGKILSISYRWMLRRLRRKPQLRITIETSETFGTPAANLKQAGRDPHVRVNDLWLAAQAIQRDFRLLTSNAKDFADIPGLQVVVLKLP